MADEYTVRTLGQLRDRRLRWQPMPLAAKNNLDELYARQRLLQEAARDLER